MQLNSEMFIEKFKEYPEDYKRRQYINNRLHCGNYDMCCDRKTEERSKL